MLILKKQEKKNVPSKGRNLIKDSIQICQQIKDKEEHNIKGALMSSTPKGRSSELSGILEI